MNISRHIAGKRGNGLLLVIAGTAVVSVCIAGFFAGLVSASIAANKPTYLDSAVPCRAPLLLAQQDDAGISAVAEPQDTTQDGRNEAGATSKTTPPASESDDLEKFTPSEEIEADQGVDFPYDI